MDTMNIPIDMIMETEVTGIMVTMIQGTGFVVGDEIIGAGQKIILQPYYLTPNKTDDKLFINR